MNKTHTPHDAIAKKFLTDVSIAKDFLEAHLPEEIKKHCDFSSLTLESSSFVEKDLAQHFSDILHKVRFTYGENSTDGYIYMLLEHQSTPDELLPFRILRYQAAIIKRHLEKHEKDKSRHSKIPIVIPLVLYNGKRSPYPHSCNIVDIFENQELAKQMPLGSFNLIDLTVTSDDELIKHGKAALLEIVQKHVGMRNL